MSENKNDKAKPETPAEKKPDLAPASAVEESETKNWQFWVTKLGADKPLARGACASLKADWDSPLSEKQFTEALRAFGSGHFGNKKTKAGKK